MNGILVIDKPSDWTSHDVVSKLRGVLKERRIGHGGTLDPIATGVLPVFIGRATRAVQFCENADKEYIASLRPGIVTDTQDITGTILSETKHDVTPERLTAVLSGFIGAQEQIPPMYSAVKIGGKKLYDLARRGIEIERTPREIIISKLELIGHDGVDFSLRIVCSKGTYIRTLCHDIGERLGCGGVMSSLRRTRVGRFTENSALVLSSFCSLVESGQHESHIRPVELLFSDCPSITLVPSDTVKCRNGVKISVLGLSDGRYRVFADDGSFLMLGEVKNNLLITVKSFFELTPHQSQKGKK